MNGNLIETIIETAHEAILILDETLKVQLANQSFLRLAHVRMPDIQGRILFELGNRRWDLRPLHGLFDELLSQQPEVKDFEIKLPIPHRGERTFLLNARWLQDATSPRLLFLDMEDVTEKKQADDQDAWYEKRFRSVFEYTPIGIAILDTLGRIKQCNPGFVSLLDQSEEKLFQRHLRDVISGEDRDANELQFQRLLSNEIGSYEIELRFQRESGESVWARQIVASLNGRSKEASEMVVSAKDISKRKLDDSRIAADLDAMTKLQGIGSMYVRGRDSATVLDAIVDAAISINSASFGNIQLFNSNTGALTIAAQRGFAPRSGEFWNSCTSDGVAHQVALQHGNRVIINDIEKNPGFFSSEAFQQQREAGIRSFVATPLTSRTGRHLGVFTTYYPLPHTPDERNLTLLDLLARQAADIIDRQEAEAILHDRDERLQSILDAASDSIVSIDSKGIITSINAATEKMFGYPREELIGKNVKILMPEPYSEQHDSYMRRYLETGVPHVIGTGREAIAKRKDGTTFPIDLAVSEMDHLHLFTGIIRDISERKSLQHDILAIADEEQRRIRQDLHDSVQQELAAAGLVTQTLLRYIDRNRDALPATFTDPCKSLAEKISSSINRAHREVREISKGLVSLPLTPTALVDSLRELATRTDEIEGISCAFACDTPGKSLNSVEATHLYRIAQEAVTNALKHSQPEHILIKLTLDQSQCTLQIADDGKGFDVRLHSGGMGINTMRYRSGLIGGTLTICPVENGGTLVCCRIPRNEYANDKQRVEP